MINLSGVQFDCLGILSTNVRWKTPFQIRFATCIMYNIIYLFNVCHSGLGAPDIFWAHKTSTGVCFLSFSADRLAQNSARSHFGVTCLEKTPVGVTSGSLRGHLARETSARFDRPARRDLGSGSLRGHFGATWLKKTRLGVT